MDNLITIKCADTTYLCNLRPNNNFNEEDNLLVGIVNNNYSNYNIFKSVLRFYISDLNFNSIKNIYLCLFLEDIHPTISNSTITVSISGNNNEFNIPTSNWKSLPQKNTNNQINVAIPSLPLRKYIKIDVSHIIKSLNSSTNICNIIMEPLNFNSSSMIQFNSINGQNPPYLILVNNDIDDKNLLDDCNSNDKNFSISNNKNVNDTKEFHMEDFSYKIINKLKKQDSRFDILEDNLSNLNDSLSAIINTIKSNSANLDNKILPALDKFESNFSNINDNANLLKESIEKFIKQNNLTLDSSSHLTEDFNELIKTEIYQLKNSVNSDILDLKSYQNKSLSDLNNSIKDITKTLLQLSEQILKISKALEITTIEPLSNNHF